MAILLLPTKCWVQLAKNPSDGSCQSTNHKTHHQKREHPPRHDHTTTTPHITHHIHYQTNVTSQHPNHTPPTQTLGSFWWVFCFLVFCIYKHPKQHVPFPHTLHCHRLCLTDNEVSTSQLLMPYCGMTLPPSALLFASVCERGVGLSLYKVTYCWENAITLDDDADESSAFSCLCTTGKCNTSCTVAVGIVVIWCGDSWWCDGMMVRCCDCVMVWYDVIYGMLWWHNGRVYDVIMTVITSAVAHDLSDGADHTLAAYWINFSGSGLFCHIVGSAVISSFTSSFCALSPPNAYLWR